MASRTALLLCLAALPAGADEGMWLFNQFPKDTVKQKYNFEVTDAFLDKLRLASLRIGSGAGSFVSPRGLILTSYRTAQSCIPATPSDQETRCNGLQGEVLVALEDVTRQVKDAKETGKPAEILQKRTAAAARLEKACADRTGGHCAVVKLSSGERYDLYRYKRYTDLRLVFAPEAAAALFGGDAEHYNYPRYDFDIAFLRAYENGKPADTPHFLKWSAEGVKDTDLVFVAGSPSSTSRLATAAQLAFYRDTELPFRLARLQARIRLLRDFSAKSADNQRIAQPLLSSLSAEYKATAGRYIGLKDDRLMARKTNFERRLRTSVERDPKLGTEAGKVWDEVAAAYKNWTPFEKAYQVLAATPVPAYKEEALETVMLAQYVEELKTLGEKEVPVKALATAKTPQDLAHLLEDRAGKLRRKHEETIESLEASSAEKIAQYRFRVFGASDYPDATSTPRVTFGSVKAYRDKTEAPVPFATTFGGLYHLAVGRDPYILPPRWMEAKSTVDLVMPYNFVSTCDTPGGSSGSPSINSKGEIVGMVFDGNIESLALTYIYTDDQARAVHVASQGIVEALRKLYRVPELLQELGVPVS